jgi:hypothetical protein
MDAPRPNVFVVGDAKCGTTSLHRFFELAPGVGVAATRKELHFFSEPELMARRAGPGDERVEGRILHDEAAYLAEFAGLDRSLPVIADVSPSYLQMAGAAARIHAFAPQAKIVILLREPADKVFSQYVHLWSQGRETASFAAAFAAAPERRRAGWSDLFDYDTGGFYAAAVGRYLDLFGPERVLVLLFEDMIRDWPGVRARLAAFLAAPLPETALPKMNIGGKVRSPVMAALMASQSLRGVIRAVAPIGLRTKLSEKVSSAVATDKPVLDPGMRARLDARFGPDARALEALLGQPTGWTAARDPGPAHAHG